MNALADTTTVDWNALENVASPNFQNGSLADLITAVYPYIFTIAGLIMLFYIIYSGYQYMLAGGDAKNIEQAKKNLEYSLKGFLVIFASYWIVAAIGRIFSIQQISNMFR